MWVMMRYDVHKDIGKGYPCTHATVRVGKTSTTPPMATGVSSAVPPPTWCCFLLEYCLFRSFARALCGLPTSRLLRTVVHRGTWACHAPFRARPGRSARAGTDPQDGPTSLDARRAVSTNAFPRGLLLNLGNVIEVKLALSVTHPYPDTGAEAGDGRP